MAVRPPGNPTLKAAPKGQLKAPAINLVLRQDETVDDILQSLFIMTPYSQEKAANLIAYLEGNPDIGGADLRDALRQSFGRQLSPQELRQIIELESDFEAANLDPKIKSIIQSLFPVTVVKLPFSNDKAKRLLSILQPVQNPGDDITTVIGFIDTPPVTMIDYEILRDALNSVRNNAGRYGIDRDNLNRELPIALIGPEEIADLKRMTYPDRSLVFDRINRQRLNDAISVILLLGYAEGRAYIANTRAASELMFNLPVSTMKKARDNYQMNIKLLKSKPEVRIDSVFPCLKCQSKNVISSEKQTRSADEPMTVFFACLNCGNNWKMN